METVNVQGKKILSVKPEALRLLASQAMIDIAHLLRPGHLQQLSGILKDPDASSNDRFVALELLKNANVAAGKILPGCQDTGTAIVMGKRGQYVWTDGNDEEALSRGIFDTYTKTNLRYSQVAPLDMFSESNTKTNLPAQVGSTREYSPACPACPACPAFPAACHHGRHRTYVPSSIDVLAAPQHPPPLPGGAPRCAREQVPLSVHGQGRWFGQQDVPVPADQGAAECRDAGGTCHRKRVSCRSFLAAARNLWSNREGPGCRAEWFVSQTFMEEKIATLGTSACPPYHLAVVIGGLSAEMTLKVTPLRFQSRRLPIDCVFQPVTPIPTPVLVSLLAPKDLSLSHDRQSNMLQPAITTICRLVEALVGVRSAICRWRQAYSSSSRGNGSIERWDGRFAYATRLLLRKRSCN